MDFRQQNFESYKNKKPDEKQAKKVREGFFDKLKKFIKKIPFAVETVALYLLFTDDTYPLIKKGIAVLALLYFINPSDFVPDAIPGAGFLDDAGIISAAIKIYGDDIKMYRKKAKEWLKDNNFT